MHIEPVDVIPSAVDYVSDWDEYRMRTDKTKHCGYHNLIDEFLEGNAGHTVEVIYDTDAAPPRTIYSGLLSARRKRNAPVDVILRGDRVFMRQREWDRAAMRRSVIATLEGFASDANEERTLTIDFGEQTRAAHSAFNYQRRIMRLGQVHIAMRGGVIVLTKDL